MRGDVPGATIGKPVRSFQVRTQSIGEMYQRAAASGNEVKLYSREESEAINVQYQAQRQANYQEIAHAEMRPTGYSTRRLLTRR